MRSSGDELVTSDTSTLSALLEHVPDLLQGFAAFDNTELIPAIDAVLARLGSIVQVDRTYLFRVRRCPEGARFLDNDHEWCAPGITPQIDQLQGLPIEMAAAWLPQLEAGSSHYIPRVSELPRNRPDREALLAQGIQSLLVTPLIGAGDLIGFIGFDAVAAERCWSTDERLLLGVVANAVCSALLRQDALRELSDRERRYRILAEQASDVTVILTADGRLREVSPSVTALMGWEPAMAIGEHWRDQVHPDDHAHLQDALHHSELTPATPVQVGDHRIRHADGSWRWFAATATDLRSEPTIRGTLIVSHDINARKRTEDILAHQALHDPLTGLPNRALLLDRLSQTLERTRRHDGTVAVVFLDLDHFKLFNDSFGHARGDELLRACAGRLQGAVREADTIARFGGDEFVVILDGTDRAEDAWVAAHRIMDALQAPITIAGAAHEVTASAGFVLATDDSTAEDLLRDADTAMYQAKRSGREQVSGLDPALRTRLLEDADLLRDLRGAAERNELTVEYQPIFTLHDDACIGYEALVRWDHPTLGRIVPDRFIPLAEEHGLIGAIGDEVLSQGLAQLVAWDARYPGHEQRTMAINLSVHQLHDQHLVERVAAQLALHGVAAERLTFELTESTLMAEPEASKRVLDELRLPGCRIAIDDFGTGYSSLSYLRELPVTTLKVDRSFVRWLGQDERDARVVTVVLSLAAEFGLTTVAEGIETGSQRDVLESLGCSIGQGYLLSRPSSPALLEGQTFMPMARSSSRT